MNIARLVLVLPLCVSTTVGHAKCHSGTSVLQFSLRELRTKQEDSLLDNWFIRGSMNKDLKSTAVESYLGCFIPKYDWIAVQIGYIPKVQISTEARAAVVVGPYRSSEISVTRRYEVNLTRYSVLMYSGNERSKQRAFLEIDFFKARGRGEARVAYGKYFVGGEDYRDAHSFAPAIGATFQLTPAATVVTKYYWFGPKAHALALGVNLSF